MPAHTRTVLVIDDEEEIRNVVRWTLEGVGYAVRQAPNGIVGLNVLQASNESLVVLLDLMMPRMSGLELLRTLAEDPMFAGRHAYIVFSAAREFYPASLSVSLPGKQLFDVSKPFNLDHLVTVVEQAAQQLTAQSEHHGDEGEGEAVVSTRG